MRVLVACEYSGRVREAFRKRGHDAWSCDLLPSEDDSPFHIQGDCLELLGDNWDLLIAHPPCTYLSVSGMHWTTRGLRDPQLTEDAIAFVKNLMDAPIAKIAIENPVSVISSRIRKPDQIVNPWWFGDDASKKTCLWLKSVVPLSVDCRRVIPPRGWGVVHHADEMSECDCCGGTWCDRHNNHFAECECIGPTEDEVTYKQVDGVLFGTRSDPPPKMRWSNQCDSGQNNLGPSPDRWKERSRTYQGIADAMAEQWGGAK